jgi:hypothetical protein
MVFHESDFKSFLSFGLLDPHCGGVFLLAPRYR